MPFGKALHLFFFFSPLPNTRMSIMNGIPDCKDLDLTFKTYEWAELPHNNETRALVFCLWLVVIWCLFLRGFNQGHVTVAYQQDWPCYCDVIFRAGPLGSASFWKKTSGRPLHFKGLFSLVIYPIKLGFTFSSQLNAFDTFLKAKSFALRLPKQACTRSLRTNPSSSLDRHS